MLGCDIANEDRVLVAVAYHTRSLRGSRYEVPMRVPGLDEGGFDAQSIYTFPTVNAHSQAGCVQPCPVEPRGRKSEALAQPGMIKMRNDKMRNDLESILAVGDLARPNLT